MLYSAKVFSEGVKIKNSFLLNSNDEEKISLSLPLTFLLFIFAAVAIVITIIVTINVISAVKERRAKRIIQLKGYDKNIDVLKIRVVTLVNEDFEEEVEVLKGETFVAPLRKRNGYTFSGWFYDSACTEPYKNTKILNDITLYSKWIKTEE